MSRAVVATAFGGPEVLSVVDVEVPAPGPGEVLIEVRAAGVNRADAKSYTGEFGRDVSTLPKRLGFEVAGEVSAVGPDAVGPAGPVSVGDHVIAHRVSGGYAERVVVPASIVVPRPKNLTWEQAGGLLLTGVTAVHALTAAGVGTGDTVLVHGAAGGVGLMAVQLASLLGAKVIGTASERNHDHLRGLAVQPTTYGPGLADRVRALAPHGVDVALDLVGTDEAMDVSLDLVPDRARIVTIANITRGPQEGVILLGGGPGADPGEEVRAAARLPLVDAVRRGDLHVEVEHAFPLDDVVEAHKQLLSGHNRGKLVLVP
jgi:NADPH2:quinone reductase